MQQQRRHHSRATVRILIDTLLPSAPDLDRLFIDHFPDVMRRTSTDMERVVRVNLLLQLAPPAQVIAALRQMFPQNPLLECEHSPADAHNTATIHDHEPTDKRRFSFVRIISFLAVISLLLAIFLLTLMWPRWRTRGSLLESAPDSQSSTRSLHYRLRTMHIAVTKPVVHKIDSISNPDPERAASLLLFQQAMAACQSRNQEVARKLLGKIVDPIHSASVRAECETQGIQL